MYEEQLRSLGLFSLEERRLKGVHPSKDDAKKQYLSEAEKVNTQNDQKYPSRYICKVTWQLKDHFNLELHEAEIFMPLMEQEDNRPYLYSDNEVVHSDSYIRISEYGSSKTVHKDTPSYSGPYDSIYSQEIQYLFILVVTHILPFHCPLQSVSEVGNEADSTQELVFLYPQLYPQRIYPQGRVSRTCHSVQSRVNA
ncbi:hypothetical protein DUI87_12728 [Hirundo rustica rustica]|uniref:Uncharacterized protein n=1 Tax=Hirundo rustica rustica TaxID=333673 RepID=A0A3M0KBT4_HIRRU|nr:hypothetical protein DUI87_12728 [Hirundo rustica rustica]